MTILSFWTLWTIFLVTVLTFNFSRFPLSTPAKRAPPILDILDTHDQGRPTRTALQQTHFGHRLPSFWTPCLHNVFGNSGKIGMYFPVSYFQLGPFSRFSLPQSGLPPFWTPVYLPAFAGDTTPAGLFCPRVRCPVKFLFKK